MKIIIFKIIIKFKKNFRFSTFQNIFFGFVLNNFFLNLKKGE
jgi:hypothetical protein